MTISTPSELSWLALVVVGQEWPDGDEDRLFAVGNAWIEAGADLHGLTGRLDTLPGAVHGSLTGAAGDELVTFLRRLRELVPVVAGAAGALGEYSRRAAVEIQYTKLMIIGQLAWLAVEIALAAYNAWWSMGASLAAVPALVAGTRFSVSLLLRRLVRAVAAGAAYGVAFQAGLDAVVQGVQFLLGDRSTWDFSKTAFAAGLGAFGGVTGGLLATAAGGIAPRFAASWKGLVAQGTANEVLVDQVAGAVFGDSSAFGLSLLSGFAGSVGASRARPSSLQPGDLDITAPALVQGAAEVPPPSHVIAGGEALRPEHWRHLLDRSPVRRVSAEFADVRDSSHVEDRGPGLRPRVVLESVHGLVAYDHQRVVVTDADGGRERAVQQYTLNVHLRADDGVTAAELAGVRERAEQFWSGQNSRYSLPSGDQFHAEVRFVDAPADANAIVEVRAPAEGVRRLDQNHWPVDAGTEELGHEMLHWLGLPDEHVDPGLVLQHAGASRVFDHQHNVMARAGGSSGPELQARHLNRIESTMLSQVNRPLDLLHLTDSGELTRNRELTRSRDLAEIDADLHRRVRAGAPSSPGSHGEPQPGAAQTPEHSVVDQFAETTDQLHRMFTGEGDIEVARRHWDRFELVSALDWVVTGRPALLMTVADAYAARHGSDMPATTPFVAENVAQALRGLSIDVGSPPDLARMVEVSNASVTALVTGERLHRERFGRSLFEPGEALRDNGFMWLANALVKWNSIGVESGSFVHAMAELAKRPLLIAEVSEVFRSRTSLSLSDELKIEFPRALAEHVIARMRAGDHAAVRAVLLRLRFDGISLLALEDRAKGVLAWFPLSRSGQASIDTGLTPSRGVARADAFYTRDLASIEQLIAGTPVGSRRERDVALSVVADRGTLGRGGGDTGHVWFSVSLPATEPGGTRHHGRKLSFGFYPDDSARGSGSLSDFFKDGMVAAPDPHRSEPGDEVVAGFSISVEELEKGLAYLRVLQTSRYELTRQDCVTVAAKFLEVIGLRSAERELFPHSLIRTPNGVFEGIRRFHGRDSTTSEVSAEELRRVFEAEPGIPRARRRLWQRFELEVALDWIATGRPDLLLAVAREYRGRYDADIASPENSSEEINAQNVVRAFVRESTDFAEVVHHLNASVPGVLLAERRHTELYCRSLLEDAQASAEAGRVWSAEALIRWSARKTASDNFVHALHELARRPALLAEIGQSFRDATRQSLSTALDVQMPWTVLRHFDQLVRQGAEAEVDAGLRRLRFDPLSLLAVQAGGSDAVVRRLADLPSSEEPISVSPAASRPEARAWATRDLVSLEQLLAGFEPGARTLRSSVISVVADRGTLGRGGRASGHVSVRVRLAVAEREGEAVLGRTLSFGYFAVTADASSISSALRSATGGIFAPDMHRAASGNEATYDIPASAEDIERGLVYLRHVQTSRYKLLSRNCVHVADGFVTAVLGERQENELFRTNVVLTPKSVFDAIQRARRPAR